MKGRSTNKSPVQSVKWADRICLVKVRGDVNMERSRAFQDETLSLVEQTPSRVVVDLSDVSYMDSAGVASLVKLLSRTRQAGVELVLFGLQQQVQGVFEITRLSAVFDIRATEQEALT